MVWRKDWFGTLAAVVAVGVVPGAVAAQTQRPQDQSKAVAADSLIVGANLILRIDGMSCPFCAYGLEKKLKELDAVDTLVVRVSDGLVAMRIREGRNIPDTVLHELVTQAGFSLREVVRPERQ